MAKDQMAVRLPAQANAMLDDLIRLGLYGTSRGEVARTLILDQLKRLAAEKIIEPRRHLSPRNETAAQ